MAVSRVCWAVVFLMLWTVCTVARATHWDAELVWSLEYPDGLPFELFDKQQNNIKANLLGVCIVGDGFVVYNRISNQVERRDGEGTILWSVGEIGQGPEDHNEPCDVRTVPSGKIALCDYSSNPKVIYYDTDGNYLSFVSLRGYTQCHRIEFDDRERITGLMSSIRRKDKGKYVVQVEIVRFDREGFPIANKMLNSVTLSSPGRGRTAFESECWPFPRIEVADNGWIYWQPDLQYERVEILDEDLACIGSLGDGSIGQPRGESEIDSVLSAFAGHVVPMKEHHAIWHMSLRPDRSLWILPQAPVGENLVFKRYRWEGGESDLVTVKGVGRASGEYTVDRNGHLLFIGCPDPETTAMTCVRLYRLKLEK